MKTILDSMSTSFEQLLAKMQGWIDQIILFLPNILPAGVIGATSFYLSRYVRRFSVKALSRFTKNKTIPGFSSNLASAVFGKLSCSSF